MLPPFHGEALKRWTETIAEIAHAELDTWAPGRAAQGAPADAGADARGDPARDLRQPRPRAPRRAARGARPDRLDAAPDRDVARPARRRPVRALPAAPSSASTSWSTRASTRPATATRSSTCSNASGATPRGAARPARDAARRRPRDDRDRARVGARAARPPPRADSTTTRTSTPFVKEVLRTRPVLSITARKTLQPYRLGGHTLPAGVYVAPCLYLAHRRRHWPDPTRSTRSAS